MSDDKTKGHTALPWDYFVGNANGRGLIRIEADGQRSEHGGHHIASMPRGTMSEANAALIVRAVNSIGDGIAAAEEAKAALFGCREVLGSIANIQHAIDLLDAFLARAGKDTA